MLHDDEENENRIEWTFQELTKVGKTADEIKKEINISLIKRDFSMKRAFTNIVGNPAIYSDIAYKNNIQMDIQTNGKTLIFVIPWNILSAVNSIMTKPGIFH